MTARLEGKNGLPKVLFVIAAWALLLAVVGECAVRWIIPDYVELRLVPSCLSVFFGLLLAAEFIALGKKQGDGVGYGRMFMLIKGLKLFLSIAGALVYAFFHKSVLIPFIVIFAGYYMVYSVFEALYLLKLNKDYQEKQ